ncbi:hypothetical protein SAMN05421780_10269 [Flexibacter flexilis DSM 6793]|uniref:EF-hand domain-containing protein n=1 Tax=Flexibacter flexilis DSM 6793 TaxID=927664 RepID=A0A1I1F6I6_9BACT|nr:hypothetical protein [Flexibacter flexilis]SFB94907.1 hypothetical protein SAMN05421780_10269 [Flexibacter flexilis DSM 6793]
MKYSCLVLGFLAGLVSCSSDSQLESKGFAVHQADNASSVSRQEEEKRVNGFSKDSLVLETRPNGVLLTGIQHVRLTPLYKVNIDQRDGSRFIGSNTELHYEGELKNGNNWNNHFLPGLQVVCGYNLVNISHNDLETNQRKNFFDKPVLIKNLYYPSFLEDTLKHKTVKRNYFMVSVYNEDTNHDGFINLNDLRRFYWFDSKGNRQALLVPDNYSVVNSEYDLDNDFLFVFARLDKNANGQIEDSEPLHIFWVDLKNPTRTGLQY